MELDTAGRYEQHSVLVVYDMCSDLSSLEWL